ncbi:hypothetical protein H6A16_05775 [Collinsella tanakaei]|uniref:hypothetical protein n=1 Tax=Collinsella tanakaei TaxID=626935 RepID=UPI00195868A0|nr:hypothetical protein [Collinsella tanakaei]MBM6779001.1 hypothetical protein [Collinsella tanakaei]
MSKKSNVDKIRAAKEAERAKAKPRSVDNDILFSLPAAKAMFISLAAGIACNVISYFGGFTGIELLESGARYVAYAFYALTFFLLVVARVQAGKLTKKRRAEQQQDQQQTTPSSTKKKKRRRK